MLRSSDSVTNIGRKILPPPAEAVPTMGDRHPEAIHVGTLGGEPGIGEKPHAAVLDEERRIPDVANLHGAIVFVRFETAC